MSSIFYTKDASYKDSVRKETAWGLGASGGGGGWTVDTTETTDDLEMESTLNTVEMHRS